MSFGRRLIKQDFVSIQFFVFDFLSRVHVLAQFLGVRRSLTLLIYHSVDPWSFLLDVALLKQESVLERMVCLW